MEDVEAQAEIEFAGVGEVAEPPVHDSNAIVARQCGASNVDAAVAEVLPGMVSAEILEIGASPLVVVNNKAEGSAPASIQALAEALATD